MNKTTKSELELKLTATQVQIVTDWRELDAQIAKLTAERDSIKGQLQEHVEAHGAHICTHRGKLIAEMREWHRNIIDSKRLKVEAPAVAAAYTKGIVGPVAKVCGMSDKEKALTLVSEYARAKKDDVAHRDSNIAWARRTGATFREIADAADLSPQGVRKIVAKQVLDNLVHKSTIDT